MIWVIGILCLIFLVIFHEFGHFIAAKICGVKVESFSVGFGPVLLHRKIGDTDYRLSLLPLGGYCGIKGEKDFQKALDEKLPEIKGEKDSLYGISPIKRAFIGFNGPFFNIILAVICFHIINLIGYSYTTFSNKIIIPDPSNTEICSIARDAGIQTGDQIIFVNDVETQTFIDIQKEITTRPDEDVQLTVLRNGEKIIINLHTKLNKETGTGQIGIMADVDSEIELHTPHYNYFTGLIQAIKDAANVTKMTYKGIQTLFKGVEIKNTVSGPVRTTQMLGSSIKAGFGIDAVTGLINMLQFIAIISMSLAIFNLLPIPVLDGGLIFIALIEWISRKKIKPIIQYYIQFIGLAFIVIIFFIGLYGDISYFISK